MDFSFPDNSKVLFITTKNLDYLRNTQEVNLLLRKGYQVTVIGSKSKRYPVRLVYVYWRLLFTRVRKYDGAFIGFSPQLVLPWFGWKFKNTTTWIDFFISFYETLVEERKWFGKNSLASKLLAWMDRKTACVADICVFHTQADASFFSSLYTLPSNKTQVLYIEADTAIFYPREDRRPNELKNKYLVVYFGSVIPLQGVDVILDAIDMLVDRNDIFFLIIGPILDSEVQKCRPNMLNYRWLDQPDLAEKISWADLCLAGHFNGSIDKGKRCIPGKVYIYRSMKKPIILGDNVANREKFSEKDKDIIFVEMGNVKALADSIGSFFDNKYKEEHDK